MARSRYLLELANILFHWLVRALFQALELHPVDHLVPPLHKDLLHIVEEILFGESLPAFFAEPSEEYGCDVVIEASLQVLFRVGCQVCLGVISFPLVHEKLICFIFY